MAYAEPTGPTTSSAGRPTGLRLSLGRPFRLSPDDPSSLYCTMLVTHANEPDVTLNVPPEPIDVPVIGGRYLLPAALWEADGCRLSTCTDGLV